MPTTFGDYISGQTIQDSHVEAFNIPIYCLETGSAYYPPTVGGSSNAFTATFSSPSQPAFINYNAGMIVTFKANHTITGPATLNVDGLGTQNIKKNGGAALQPGDIINGQLVTVVHDGSNFHLVSPPASLRNARGAYSNLVVKNNATTPNSKVDVTADALAVWNGSEAVMLTGVNLTGIDITATGANGRQSGQTEDSNEWWFIHVIYKSSDGTVAGYLSENSSLTIPSDLPSGYDYWRLVGAVRNDGSSNFIKFLQCNDRCYYEAEQSVLSAGSALSLTGVSLAAAVPSIAHLCEILVRSHTAGDTSGNSFIELSVDGSTTYQTIYCGYSTSTGDTAWMAEQISFPISLAASRQIYYDCDNSNQDIYMDVTSWVVPL